MTDLFNIKDFQWNWNIGASWIATPTFNATDNKIQQLAVKQTAPEPTIRTQDRMFKDMAEVQKREWVTDIEALDLVKNYYAEKWYTVEWLDLNTQPKLLEWTVPPAFEDNKTFVSRIQEKARENAEIEWEIDVSNRNIFRKAFDRTANNARAFSGLVEALIWEWIETTWQLASLITPDIIEKPFKDEVVRQFEMVTSSQLAQGILTSAKWIWYTAKEVFNMMPEDIQQDIENLGVIWIWLLDLVWSGYVAKEWVKLWAKWWIALWNKTAEAKNFLFPKESLNDLIYKASQATKAEDLKAFKDSISLIDTAKMGTYNDLSNAFGKKIWVLSTKVDDMLSTTPKYNLDDLITTVWKRQTNYVKSSIDDLKKVWAKENDLEFLAKVDELEDIVKWSEKDINDLARFYGTKFKQKSFSKTTWEPLSSVTASRFENNRAWLKELVRNKNGNKALKEIDLQISELYTARWLTDKMWKSVQKLFNKTIKRWPLAWIWKGTIQLVNALSLWYVWWALSALWLQSNVGKKIYDVLSIQKNLNKTLKQIDRMEKMLDWNTLSNANKAYIERFFSEMNFKAMSILPKEQVGKLVDDVADAIPWVKSNFIDDATKNFKDEVGFKKADVSPSKTQINTKWFINPAQIVDDIAKAWNKITTPAQIEKLAKSITISMNLAKGQIKQAYEIVKRYIKEFGADIKDRLWVMIDEIADKIWVRTKFIDDTGKSYDKITDIKVKNLDPDVAVALRWMKWLWVEDIIKKNPDLWLKRDVPVTDIHWNKSVISKWEVLTPYELKGNKILLQDWETYIVSKSQYKNITQNSTVAEWKPFAPELEWTRETVKWVKWPDEIWSPKKEARLKELEKMDKKNPNWAMEDIEAWSYDEYTTLLNIRDNSSFQSLEALRQQAENIARRTQRNEDWNKVHLYTARQETLELTTTWGLKNPTKYGDYQLPWGENYKEILIQAPALKIKNPFKIRKVIDEDWVASYDIYKVFDNWDDYVISSIDKLEDAEEYLKKINTWEAYWPKTQFQSWHFDEPDIIATNRMNERTYKGKKVAFSEEIQSDWASAGRKDWFKFEWNAEDLLPKGWKADFNWINYVIKDNLWNKVPNKLAPWSWYVFASNKEQAIGMAIGRADLMPSRWVPNNPLLKKWTETATKRWLKEAVDTNAEYYAWTTWNQQKARYSLSKQIDDIEWKYNPEGFTYNKTVVIKPKNWDTIWVYLDKDWIITNNTQGWKWKTLDEALWKWVAEKIMKTKDWKLKWEWLNIGWEWANTLYDKQVVNIVEDLTKWKVEYIDLGLTDKNAFKVQMWTETPLVPLTKENISKNIGRWTTKWNKNYTINKDLWNWKFQATEIYSDYWRWNPKPEIFTITPPELQPAIKLTPEIKRIIKWEAPVLEKIAPAKTANK